MVLLPYVGAARIRENPVAIHDPRALSGRTTAKGLPTAELKIIDLVGFAPAVADWMARVIERTIVAKGSCSVGLAGGTTPRAIYSALAKVTTVSASQWALVSFYFGDERLVPMNDPDSNFRLAHETLFAPLAIAPARVHRVPTESSDRDEMVRSYACLLPAALDLLHLGMGADGHTASLFPGSSALLEATRRVVLVTGPKPPFDRITITPPVIDHAAAVLLTVTGAEKASAVQAALDGQHSPLEIPATLAARVGGTWFLDPAAAGKLERVSR